MTNEQAIRKLRDDYGTDQLIAALIMAGGGLLSLLGMGTAKECNALVLDGAEAILKTQHDKITSIVMAMRL